MGPATELQLDIRHFGILHVMPEVSVYCAVGSNGARPGQQGGQDRMNAVALICPPSPSLLIEPQA